MGPGVTSTGPRGQLECHQHDWWRDVNPVPHAAEVNWKAGSSTAADAVAASPFTADATGGTSIADGPVANLRAGRVFSALGVGFDGRRKVVPITAMLSGLAVLDSASAWGIMVQET